MFLHRSRAIGQPWEQWYSKLRGGTSWLPTIVVDPYADFVTVVRDCTLPPSLSSSRPPLTCSFFFRIFWCFWLYYFRMVRPVTFFRWKILGSCFVAYLQRLRAQTPRLVVLLLVLVMRAFSGKVPRSLKKSCHIYGGNMQIGDNASPDDVCGFTGSSGSRNNRVKPTYKTRFVGKQGIPV